jgi:hypothetical protein
MPGWTAPFSTDMEMRGFAERTIQQETPSHLVVKTCWVGNEGYAADPCDPVVDSLASVLEEHGRTDSGDPPSREDACSCAARVLTAYREAFDAWYEDKTLEHHRAEGLADKLTEVFVSVDLTAVDCAAEIDDALRDALQSVAIERFQEIVLRGRQFERFEDAWCSWLRADASIDWTEERLLETVTAVLKDQLAAKPVDDAAEARLCRVAADILAAFGADFAEWRDNCVDAGTPPDFTVFHPSPIAVPDDLALEPGGAAAVHGLLMERYSAYSEVSYRLRILVDVLGDLRNTYPSGTLHDCDEGDDRNPIRLSQTALGSNVQ